jgi:ABC-type multidrug transport system fused ATPase/permease subunit
LKEFITKTFRLFTPKEKVSILFFVLSSFFLSILDLIALVLLGTALALSTNILLSQPSNIFERFTRFFEFLNLGSVNSILIIMSVSGILFLFKSVFSYFLLKKYFNFLSNIQLNIVDRLLGRLFSSSILVINSKPSSQRSYALINGASSLVMGIVGNAFIISAELISALSILFLISLINIELSIFILAFSIVSGYLIHTKLEKWAILLGREIADSDSSSLTYIQQTIQGYREFFTLSRLGLSVNEIHRVRGKSTVSQSKIYILNHVTKFFLELIIISSAIILLLFLLLSKDIISVVIEVTFFASALVRILPSLLRFQSALLSLKASIGMSKDTLELADELKGQSDNLPDDSAIIRQTNNGIKTGHAGFISSIRVQNLSFRYPGSKKPILNNFSMQIFEGEMVAIQGKSGSGKSTLIDLILGILTPTNGVVEISGMDCLEAIKKWPGAIGYVPQSARIINGSIKQNIAFGIPSTFIDEDLIWEALGKAQLTNLVKQRSGLETNVGELGFELSGGQRQRLGLARALYTKPKLIILDEATSSLDAETESKFFKDLEAFRSESTIVLVSHKPNALDRCDKKYEINADAET